MQEAPLTDPARPTIDHARIAAGWPVLLAIAVWAFGLPLLPHLLDTAITGAAMATLIGFGTLALVAAGAVLLHNPEAPITAPFVALGAVTATLLALAPLDLPASAGKLAGFLLVAPWRYALTPLVVHFALEMGWSHRRQRWSGWVAGWYAVQLGMLVVVTIGLLLNEVPLVNAVDLTFRGLIVEPIGALAALASTALALAAPIRGRAFRRPLLWTLLAIIVGLGPLLLADVIPVLGQSLDGVLTPSRLALLGLPVFGLIAVLSIPFRDARARDLAAHRLAASLLEGTDLAASLRDIAAELHARFSTRGVVVRLAEPETTVSIGEVSLPDAGAPLSRDVEADDERHDLMAPIGRAANPLGDVRMEARFAGAFGSAEREWLAAFLVPIAAVLRARRREFVAVRRNDALARQSADSMTALARAADQLPANLGPQSLSLPPVVDAREVLAQLSDGVTGVARHGEGLAATAGETRDSARGTSDAIARALDALSALHIDVGHLARHGDDIAASNDTVSGVAFRTNLVANNAALEATRAGPAGRTFGVLADEVRRLADTTAATSAAIGERTASLASDVTRIGLALEGTRHALAAAIREAEAGEAAAQRLNDAAAELEDAARSLRPAVAEANAVAKRRTARDSQLTTMMEQFIVERTELSRALTEHRDAIDRLAHTLSELTAGSR